MSDRISLAVDQACIWSGWLFLALMGVGLIQFAHFFPPHAPGLDAGQIAALYRDNMTGIRTGMVLMLFSAMFGCVLVTLLAQRVSEVEGRNGPLTWWALLGGFGGMFVFFLVAMWFEITAFRPERPPEITLALSDTSWLLFVGAVPPAIPQLAALGLAAFLDERAEPTFPRWYGYLCCWMIALGLPGVMCFYFRVGPFAWDGIFPFWIPFAMFAIFFVSTLTLLHRDVKRRIRSI